MLARHHRFHGHNSLRAVYQRGRLQRSRSFAVRTLNNPRRQTYRAAVVVSRKVSKSAVVRNRIRRRIYEQLRLQVAADTSQDIIVSVFSDDVASMPTDQLAEAIGRTLVTA